MLLIKFQCSISKETKAVYVLKNMCSIYFGWVFQANFTGMGIKFGLNVYTQFYIIGLSGIFTKVSGL